MHVQPYPAPSHDDSDRLHFELVCPAYTCLQAFQAVDSKENMGVCNFIEVQVKFLSLLPSESARRYAPPPGADFFLL
jgi:hypothetical protein